MHLEKRPAMPQTKKLKSMEQLFPFFMSRFYKHSSNNTFLVVKLTLCNANLMSTTVMKVQKQNSNEI